MLRCSILIKNNLGPGFEDLEKVRNVWYKDKGGKKRSFIDIEVALQGLASFAQSQLVIGCMLQSGIILDTDQVIEIDKRSSLTISAVKVARVFLRFKEVSANHFGEV